MSTPTRLAQSINSSSPQRTAARVGAGGSMARDKRCRHATNRQPRRRRTRCPSPLSLLFWRGSDTIAVQNLCSPLVRTVDSGGFQIGVKCRRSSTGEIIGRPPHRAEKGTRRLSRFESRKIAILQPTDSSCAARTRGGPDGVAERSRPRSRCLCNAAVPWGRYY